MRSGISIIILGICDMWNTIVVSLMGGKFYLLFFLWHWFRYKRLGFKLRFTIYPNTIGSGLMIYHTGDFVHVGENVRTGRNCTLLLGVVFSSKTRNDKVVVGDNCRFGLGARIFGSVSIR